MCQESISWGHRLKEPRCHFPVDLYLSHPLLIVRKNDQHWLSVSDMTAMSIFYIQPVLISHAEVTLFKTLNVLVVRL